MSKIYFQGTFGAYSHLAALSIDPKAEILPCKTFDDCFNKASEEPDSRIIIPESNRITGNIGIEYLIFKHRLNIYNATCCCRMHTKIIKSMLEKLTKMVPKWSQNLSKIDPGGGLEATWEPSLKQGASKTSLLTILAPFWDPLWDQFGVILGIIF